MLDLMAAVASRAKMIITSKFSCETNLTVSLILLKALSELFV